MTAGNTFPVPRMVIILAPKQKLWSETRVLT